MTYEIPQQLQYEEKIIFGLTFKQLLYAAIFIVPSIILFLKTELDIYIKAVITTFLIGLACLFMFFNFSSYLKNMITWFKFREVSIMDSKMIEFLGIEKIENGVVYVGKTRKFVAKRRRK